MGMAKVLWNGLARSICNNGKGIFQTSFTTQRLITTQYMKRSIHSSPFLKTMYFTKGHEWLSVENNIGTVGITSYAQEQLSEVVFCEVPEIGSEYEQGDAIAVVESVKAASDVYAPASGKVVEANEKAVDNNELITKSPMDEGWLCKLELSNVSELDSLMNTDEYDKYKEGLDG